MRLVANCQIKPLVLTIRKINSLLQVILRYIKLLNWLIKDSLLRHRKKVLSILISEFIAITLQVQAIGLAIYYIRALENNKIIHFAGQNFEARTSLLLLMCFGVCISFSLIISAGLEYFSRTKLIKIWRLYEEFCSKRIIWLLGCNLRIWLPHEHNFINNKTIVNLVRRDSRYCGRIFGLLIGAINPFVTLIISSLALFYINLFLTSIILLLISVSLFFLYKINVNGARSTMLMEQYSGKAALEYRRVIHRQQNLPLPKIISHNSRDEKIFEIDNVKKYLDAFEGRLKAVVNSELISNIVFSLSICTIFIILGTRIILEGEGWSRTLTYIIALRYSFSTFKQLVRRMTSINRFYPHLKRYFDFIENTRNVNLPLQFDYSSKTTSVRSFQSKVKQELTNYFKGNRISLVSPVPLNRYTVAYLTDCLLSQKPELIPNIFRSIWFVTSSQITQPECYILQSLEFPPSYSWQSLCQELKTMGLGEVAQEQLPRKLEQINTEKEWQKLDFNLRFALVMIAIIHSNYQWIMLEETSFKLLPDIAQKYFLDRLSERIILMVFYPKIVNIGSYSEDVIAVINEQQIVGMGSYQWFKTNQAKFKRILKINHQSSKKLKHEEDFDDEFDDE